MSRKNILSFSIAFLLLIVVIIMDRQTSKKIREYSGTVEHTREVITSLERLSSYFKSAQVYSPTYERSTNEQFYHIFKLEAQKVPYQLDRLSKLVSDNTQQVKRIDSLRQMVNAQMPVLMNKNIVEIIESGDGARLKNLFEISTLIDRAIDMEDRLLHDRKEKLDEYASESTILTALFSIIAFAVIIVTFILNLILQRKRRRLEGFLESVLNTSQNGIVTYKAVRQQGKIVDFKIEFANAAIKALLHIDPEAVIGKKLGDLSASFVRNSDLFLKYVQVVETGRQMEFQTHYQQQNVQKWFNVILAKLEDSVTATFHDISDLKKYEEELQSNIEHLAQSNKELAQYAYVASHDLQEPLRKILVYADMLESSGELKSEKYKAHLNKITAAAERMSYLITDILNFSSTTREPGFVLTNLNEVWKNIVEDQELKLQQYNVQVHKDELPSIEAIPLQMNQLFYNLLSNSIKFARDGVQPQIDVRCKKLSSSEASAHYELRGDHSYFEIMFSDNGIGFSQEYADKIFGMFKRLNERQQYPGSGIGLALCRKVVENHKGIIVARGQPGEGATFIIVLPEKQ